MNIFLACPVRGVSDDYRVSIEAQVAHLESLGHKVHYPPRDTEQSDPTGLQICRDNADAIKLSDVVYVIWDGKSRGVLFDLGVAFALQKRIRTVAGGMPAVSPGKSFQNMIFAWEELTNPW